MFIKEFRLKLIFFAWISIISMIFANNYTMISELGTSADMISIANIEGFSRDSSGVFENPAALYRVRKVGAAFFTSEIMSQSQFTLLSSAYRSQYGIFGLGYMSNDISGIPRTGAPGADGLPTVLGTFAYSNKIMKFAYGYSVSRRLHLGSTLNYYSTDIDTISASTMDFDFGMIYKWQKFTFSGSIKNVMGNKVKFARSDDASYSGEETLPRWIVLGAQYRLASWRFLAQLTKRPSHTLTAIAFKYSPSFLKFLSLQFGIKEVPILSKTQSVSTFGISFNLYGFKIVNSFQRSDHPDFDNYTYVSLHIDL